MVSPLPPEQRSLAGVPESGPRQDGLEDVERLDLRLDEGGRVLGLGEELVDALERPVVEVQQSLEVAADLLQVGQEVLQQVHGIFRHLPVAMEIKLIIV